MFSATLNDELLYNDDAKTRQEKKVRCSGYVCLNMS